MKEILKQLKVTEYAEFKRLAKERLQWKSAYYNDKKNGRLKLHPLERRELQKIVDELHKAEVTNTDIQRIHCNSDECFLFQHNRCMFASPAECPKYQPITQ